MTRVIRNQKEFNELYSATSSSKVVSRGSGDKSDKQGKILHSASVNKPHDVLHNETSW
jgi:hypothetical protein